MLFMAAHSGGWVCGFVVLLQQYDSGKVWQVPD